MAEDRDLYQAFHAAKLWALLPEVYRAEDTDALDRNGPLRELVNRIGVQAAVLRRSLDRMWDDQSIETCDDWLIPYIGDLVATNLVPAMPARAQRLDVAKTIYYRRRKGTLAVLEEIATNLTEWEVRLVEFFRRLGRTRHLLDPPLGLPAEPGDAIEQLREAGQIVGPRTRTGAGGFADLRDAQGAAGARSAFDEFSHIADFRLGRGAVGWHDIPRLGVFLWRLRSFGGQRTTPVRGPEGCFTFDPTGREVPLFARSSRASNGLARNWTSPEAWQLPGPISRALYDSDTKPAPARPEPPRHLYPGSVAVYDAADTLVPVERVAVVPERGLFSVDASIPAPVGSVASFYGFSSTIGAGPYDRRVVGSPPPETPSPGQVVPYGAALPPFPPIGTVEIDDSLTRPGAPDASDFAWLVIRAGIRQRPLIRMGAPPPSLPSFPDVAPAQWVLRGAAGARLVLDGLFVSGGDIVLRGDFSRVTITSCSFDPGSTGEQLGSFALAADGRPLVPTRLWIEASIGTLRIARSITGPVRVRGKGAVETLEISDSILQAIPTGAGGPLRQEDVADPGRLVGRLVAAADPVTAFVAAQLAASGVVLAPSLPGPAAPLPQPVLDGLNALVAGPSIYEAARFAAVRLRPLTAARLAASGGAADPPALNRLLLEDAFPLELAAAALAIPDGNVSLKRCTVLGTGHVHHIDVSESILDDFVAVGDLQHGCTRFSAVAAGSLVPRQYECVAIPDGAPLFTSVDFGQPGYAQLLPEADAAILPGPAGSTPGLPGILRGAENGSEIGAFSREGNALKERGLLLKLQEFMPAGLVPVLIHVT